MILRIALLFLHWLSVMFGVAFRTIYSEKYKLEQDEIRENEKIIYKTGKLGNQSRYSFQATPYFCGELYWVTGTYLSLVLIIPIFILTVGTFKEIFVITDWLIIFFDLISAVLLSLIIKRMIKIK